MANLQLYIAIADLLKYSIATNNSWSGFEPYSWIHPYECTVQVQITALLKQQYKRFSSIPNKLLKLSNKNMQTPAAVTLCKLESIPTSPPPNEKFTVCTRLE